MFGLWTGHTISRILFVNTFIFLNDTSSMYWCIVIMENVVFRKEMSGNIRPQVNVTNVNVFFGINNTLHLAQSSLTMPTNTPLYNTGLKLAATNSSR